MTCGEMESLLAGLIDGALSDEERNRVEAHLRSCETCRKALADLKNADRLVKRMEEVEPPPWLKTRVMARVLEEAREEARAKPGILRMLFYPLHVKVPIQALATVLIAVVAWNVYKTGEPEFRQVAPPPAAVQDTQKTQVPAAPAQAPAAATAQDDRPALREKKAFAPPPAPLEDRMERKADDVREMPKADNTAPGRASEAARFAPGPQKDEEALKGSGAESRREPDRAMPMPAVEQKQKALKAPVGSVAKESAKREAAAPASPALSAAAPPRSGLEMTLRVPDPATAADRAQAILGQLHAQGVERQTRGSLVILTATLKPENLEALREKLKSLGPIREGTPAGPLPGAPVTIRLEIRPE